MSILIISVQVILMAMFTVSVVLKWGRAPSMVRHWEEYRYPMWFMYVTASLELLGVLGLFLAFWFPVLLNAASFLLAVLMIGAIHAHLFRARHKPVMALNALIMLILCTVILLS